MYVYNYYIEMRGYEGECVNSLTLKARMSVLVTVCTFYIFSLLLFFDGIVYWKGLSLNNGQTVLYLLYVHMYSQSITHVIMTIFNCFFLTLFQNSIRHNLSLNQYFMKAAREREGLGFGKGGYWCMHPDYEDKLTSQAYVKRKKKGIPVFPSAGLMSKYVK